MSIKHVFKVDLLLFVKLLLAEIEMAVQHKHRYLHAMLVLLFKLQKENPAISD